MNKTLGGFLFVMNGVKYDYNFKETISCLLEFCDKVSVLVIHGDDETADIVKWMEKDNPKLVTTYLPKEAWEETRGMGKLKLTHFQNIAASFLDTDYQFLLQADEIVHENSYAAIREAMQDGQEGYLCERVNLWQSCDLMLNVPQDRKPCSTEVIRLTKRGYRSYDDGENIAAPVVPYFIDKIKIIHYGFVRHREVMKDKITNMQVVVFEMSGADAKLELAEVFTPEFWFSGNDLKPIDFAHPVLMKDWVSARI